MSLIDADKIPWQTTKTIGDNPVEVKLVLKQSIDTMPTIEVVRCKECKHRPKRDINGEIEVPKSKRVADWSCPCIHDGICITDDDFFCKRGERG